MKYNPDVHHRRSIRLKGYDYSLAGAYCVTVCTQGRENLFGEIKTGEMVLNRAGKMVQAVWDEMPRFYPGVETDEFVIMPNHVPALSKQHHRRPTLPGDHGESPLPKTMQKTGGHREPPLPKRWRWEMWCIDLNR